MKIKKAACLIVLSALVACAVFILNTETVYKQGINYRVRTVRIPLYLKLLDFFDRHYNYKNLVLKIIDKEENPQDRAVKLFKWTHENIRPQPDSLPVVDDHVWHIIVRGYGASDQSNDVFTVLCNYAGIKAFFDIIYAKDSASAAPLSFVMLDDKWSVFDSYGGVYFVNDRSDFASLKDIKAGNWKVFNLYPAGKKNEDYAAVLDNLPDIEGIGLTRANIQSPFKRLLFQLKKGRR